MKRVMMCLCLAALLVLPLAGCSSDKTGSGMNGAATDTNPPGGGITSGVTGQGNTGGTQGDQNPGNDDLAGADGVVGGQTTQSPVGQGMEDVLDDMGDAARSLGQDARRALQ